MPRSVTAFELGPGFATYTLGKREAFTIRSFSTLAAAPTGPDDDDDLYFDCISPTGNVIYRQSLGSVHQPPVFYSLAPMAEPMENLYGQAVAQWPQVDGVNGPAVVTLRMSPVELSGSCTARVYAYLGSLQPGDDPFANLDPTYVFTPHLWVNDTGRIPSLPPNSPPLLTHIAV
jgi:hypothetical protein